MVFFTCNACGQSIRKNRVEKHWQTECPNCEVLSCMDCGKDFYGEEYAAHTSCITEAEKYQGALFKGERGGASKGDKKQQQWIQVGSGSEVITFVQVIHFFFCLEHQGFDGFKAVFSSNQRVTGQDIGVPKHSKKEIKVSGIVEYSFYQHTS